MDFRFSTEADDAADLAAQILGDGTAPARLTEVEAAGDRFDADLWRRLGEAGLLGLAIPEEHDGAGLGLLEACRVVVEGGRRVAPVPLATHVTASLLLAEVGSPEQQAAWLPGAASGERVLTAAVAEELAHVPATPTVTAEPTGDSWALTGVKVLVRAAAHADGVLVVASGPDGRGVWLAQAADVEVEPQHTSDGDTVGLVRLEGAPATRVGDETAARRLVDLLTVTACAEQWGVTSGALSLTAAYAREREQFGKPIGSFQAVAQRLADGYIDVLGQELTLWQAAWRLSEGLPCESELAVAKLFAADAGHRVAHTTVHVHGGVGIDLDGEAHRYFTAAKRWEFAHGGATEQARTVGRVLATG